MKLHPYQQEAIDTALSAPAHRWVINFDTGLGKTRTAIEFAKQVGAKRVLIVCPAVVRIGWLRELAKWGFPEEASIISIGRDREKGLSKPALERKRKAYAATVQIVSYDLAHNVAQKGWDLIVLDELHKLKSPSSKQSKAVKGIARRHKGAILGLTATLMPDRVTDLYNQLDIIWPRRWGKLQQNGKASYEFNKRYSLGFNPKGYGIKWEGVNEVHLDELRHRLAAVSSRVTKDEVAHLLPAFTVRLLQIGDKEALDIGRIPTDVLKELHKRADKKTKEIEEWAKEAMEETNHAVIFTHRRELAKRIPSEYTITGSMSPDKRLATIDSWTRSGGLLVATMHAVGIGINGLEIANRALFAELYYRPETVIQALGRLDRLGTDEKTIVDFLVYAGTIEERIAMLVQEKMESISSIVDTNEKELGVQRLLSLEPDSEDEWLAALHDVTEGYVEDDYE